MAGDRKQKHCGGEPLLPAMGAFLGVTGLAELCLAIRPIRLRDVPGSNMLTGLMTVHLCLDSSRSRP